MAACLPENMLTDTTFNIFLVSEDAFCRTMYQQLLENMGCKNIRVFTGKNECMDHVSEQPDIMILHCSQYLHQSTAMLKSIKRDFPGIYVIYISADEDVTSIDEILKQGAFTYILSGPDETQKLQHALLKIQKIITALNTKPVFYKKNHPDNPL
jgi:DNA-binding NtrC family response regulator